MSLPTNEDYDLTPAERDFAAEERARQLNWQFDGEIAPPSVSREKTVVPESKAWQAYPVGVILDAVTCADNLEAIRALPGGCVNLVITLPPYFNQREYGVNNGVGNEETLAEYLDNLLQLFAECVRVTADDGSIVWNIGDKYADASLLLVPYRFAVAATAANPVRLVNNITWVKQNPTPRQFQRRLVSSTEPFFHFVKTSDYQYDINAFCRGDEPAVKKAVAGVRLGQTYFALIAQSESDKAKARTALYQVIEETRSGAIAGFRIKIRGIHSEAFGGQEGGRKIQMDKQGFTVIRLHGNKMKRDVIETPVETVKGCKHPAIFPVAIVEEFLHLLTVPGDIVLDPYMGSGSTAVACKKHDRRYIGYEINPDYCAYAAQRIAGVNV